MLKDMGMTAPKIKETRAVLYAAAERMKACNNNMHNIRELVDSLCRDGADMPIKLIGRFGAIPTQRVY